MSDRPSAAVSITDLVMEYAGRRVVDGLSLEAPVGGITVVLGPNGAGKTTTIETAEGFRTPHGGTVRVLGADPIRDGASLRPRVGVMLQAGGAWASIRAGQMLNHVARLYSDPLPTPALLERLGLESVAGTPYRRLSGGERQRLACACALVGRPELVFLDEPTTGLDPQARLTLWGLLADLRQAGVSIVMTTHLLDEAHALADHVVVFDIGRVVAAGSVPELTAARPALRFQARPGMDCADLAADLARRLGGSFGVTEPGRGHYVVAGTITPNVVAAVASWCARAGEMPTQLSTEGGTLSDAYFELTAGLPAGTGSGDSR